LNLDRVVLEIHREHPDYVVFDEQRTLARIPAFFSNLEARMEAGERLTRVYSTEQSSKGTKQHAIIYRYQPPS
jgi:hypothetical protein